MAHVGRWTAGVARASCPEFGDDNISEPIATRHATSRLSTRRRFGFARPTDAQEMVLRADEDHPDSRDEAAVAAPRAWEKLKELLAPAVQLAEREGITLVLENGNGLMVPSAWLGRKLFDEMGSPNLKILWDPGNGLYANEIPFPDAYEALRGSALGHFHIKDAIVDMPKATVEFCEMGKGQLASSYEPIARALKEDGYDGVISLESVYRPEGGTFEDGFKASVGLFKEVFG